MTYPAVTIDGHAIAQNIIRSHKEYLLAFHQKHGLLRIASVYFDEKPNKATESYIRKQARVSHDLNIHYEVIHVHHEEASWDYLRVLFGRLNEDPSIHGIMVFAPLPEHLNGYTLYQMMNPQKDMEGLHPSNVGKLMYTSEGLLPCTAAAVLRILQETQVPLRGKEVVIIGHSHIMGKPLSLLLLQARREAPTPTICHSTTQDLAAHTRRADILIVGVGHANLITASMVKEGVCIIDVGINVVQVNGIKHIVGDVDFENVRKKASFITPVPGGVGPVTQAYVIQNLVYCLQQQYPS